MQTVLSVLLLGCALAAGSTIEVVRLYQPLSLHGTDGSGDEDEAGEPLQAAVMVRPFAVSGALPEDLVKAVAQPCEIGTNSPGYEVQESNLLVLCGIAMEVRRDEKGVLVVTFDVGKLAIMDELDVTARQVLNLAITAVRRTLEDYFSHGEASLAWRVAVTGTDKGNASLRDLGREFIITGPKKEPAAVVGE